VQPVQRHQGGHEHGDGRDHVHQPRHGEQGHLQEDERALALVHDQVEAGEALAQQRHAQERERRT
jgi:hypothetical protein